MSAESKELLSKLKQGMTKTVQKIVKETKMNEAQKKTFERKRTFYLSKGMNKGHSPLTIRDDNDEKGKPVKAALSKRSKSPMPFHGVGVSEPTGKFPAYKRTSFAQLDDTMYLQKYQQQKAMRDDNILYK